MADMVLEKMLRVLHPDLRAAAREPLGLAWAFENLKILPSWIHFRPTRSHLHSNSAIPWWQSSIQIGVSGWYSHSKHHRRSE